MKIDYKKELESASRGMIMIHDPNLLIKLIVRMIVRKLGISHAAMILHEGERDSYVLSISRGERGVKNPSGFTRFDKKSPLIKLFTIKEYRPLTVTRSAILTDDINNMIWREHVLDHGNGNGVKELLHKVDDQMQMLNSVACVPAYYQDKLLALLLLGAKQDGTKFEQEELDFFAALASDVAMAIRNAQLFEGLQREAQRNRELFIKTIMMLGATIEAKDAYTQGHTERVTKYSSAIARQMVANDSVDFDEKFFEDLYIAALLHDIGKIAIPEKILNKPGKFNDEEYELMKTHTLRGVEMLKHLPLPKECVDGIKYHHERFDGNGYPEGLKGAGIPITAAIIAVADCYDAMTSDRPYRKGLKKEKAFEEIQKCSGAQFNPIVTRAMMELAEGKKI